MEKLEKRTRSIEGIIYVHVRKSKIEYVKQDVAKIR